MKRRNMLASAGPTEVVTGRVVAGTSIVPVGIYHVPERHPRGDGPWSDEADKLTWIDPTTGLACIIRRDRKGALHGYVAVGPDHPFYGISADALPHEPRIVVHGGIDYAEPCARGEPEAISVCHVRVPRTVRGSTRSSMPHGRIAPATPSEPLPDVPAEPWWFGFGADHSYDHVPSRDGYVPLGQENGRLYRDEAYMARETTRLAAQLHAVGMDAPMPPIEGRPPPMGLDPFEPRS